jgi:hypothetical protein
VHRIPKTSPWIDGTSTKEYSFSPFEGQEKNIHLEIGMLRYKKISNHATFFLSRLRNRLDKQACVSYFSVSKHGAWHGP